MRATETQANPFFMMMNPEAVIQAVERSERLNCLTRRVCRPLDRPLIPKVRQDDLADFDAQIDMAEDAGDEGDDAAL